MHATETDEATTVDDIRLEWEEIARNEVTRHRRRLSLLTPEQQSAVESVLLSVTDHMFELVVAGAESCPRVDRHKYFSVWRREEAAA